MYSDAAKKKTGMVVLAAVLVLLVLLGVFTLQKPGRDRSEESAAAIRDTIQRNALQCYAVEGVYPPDLRYLEENYGLQINTEDYYVSYDAFASNLPPTVKVVHK